MIDVFADDNDETMIQLDAETEVNWRDVTLLVNNEPVTSESGLTSEDIQNAETLAFIYQGKTYLIEDYSGDLLEVLYQMVDPV